ncbi:MAG: 16S rRNA (guanine(527)-N(7))-methyltransferase RsmG [Defluviitaleaceae bacterium]|nr:16S rRNA (guanine(527)-N(7))-methyltransferase RsmG [Defluviitaleaceae bacterium]
MSDELLLKHAEKFAAYKNFLLERNKVMNLTSVTSEPDFTAKHFTDSLALFALPQKSARVIDVGTGAGLPGIPLAITRPDVHVTLLDSTGKKINFVREAAALLGLANVDCVCARAEDHVKNGHAYDMSVSRAVAKLNKLAAFMLPLTAPGGMMVAMKGQRILDELNEAKAAIKKYGGEFEKIIEYEIGLGIVHSLIMVRKIKI